jgi:hypothetical protein
MTNEDNPDNPPPSSKTQTPADTQVTPSAPREGALTNDSERQSNNQIQTARELAREFRVAEKWVIGTNIGLAMIGIFALCIYYSQLTVMRGQLEQIIKQYPELQRSAEAANSAATTADATLKASQRQFRNEQRPYIWLTPGIALPNNPMGATGLPELARGKMTLTINIYGMNGGHSPAIEVMHTNIIRIFDTAEIAKKEVQNYVPKYGLGEDSAPNTGFYLPTPLPAIDVTDALMDDIRNDRKRIYFLARVQYRDIFTPRSDAPYETAFCARVRSEGMPLASCEADIKQSWVK